MRKTHAVVGTTIALVALGGLLGMSAAFAAQSSVGLGKATPFVVLAGTTVTNTGPSVISGDLGVSPGKAVTGFPPGRVKNGTQHKGDALALKAQTDLTKGYNDAAGRTPATTVSGDLGGRTLRPGVYKAAKALGLTGTLTLNAHNDPGAVFIFQAGSTLITASTSSVKLIGGAQACNVFWQVGSSATLGTHSTFAGSILALTSATVRTGTTVAGRVLARNGAVTLDSDTITLPRCVSAPKTGASGVPQLTPSGAPPQLAPSGAPAESIPSGAPGTGGGGASHSRDTALIILGSLAIIGAGAAMVPAIRQRHR